jgi:hypothetical protein
VVGNGLQDLVLLRAPTIEALLVVGGELPVHHLDKWLHQIVEPVHCQKSAQDGEQAMVPAGQVVGGCQARSGPFLANGLDQLRLTALVSQGCQEVSGFVPLQRVEIVDVEKP